VRSRVRDFIETMMEEELDAVLSRPRYGHIAPDAGKEAGTAEGATGPRHGHRSRSLLLHGAMSAFQGNPADICSG